MGAGEPQVFAQQLHQQRARIDIGGDGFAVHRQGNGCHMRLLGFLLKNTGQTSRLLAAVSVAGRVQGRNRDDFCRFSTLELELL